jgi:hypothetical protein
MKGTVVASYSAYGAIKIVAFILAVVILAFGTTLYSPDGRTIAPRPSTLPTGIAFQIIIWICGTLSLLYLALFLWRLLLHKGAAIWLEGDRVVHLHRWFQSVDRDDIEDITTGTVAFSGQSIVIRMRNGSKMEVPTAALSEPGEMIIARLKQKLAQS